MRYKKGSPRVTVEVYEGDAEEPLFTVPDRTWMDAGEFLSDAYVTMLCKQMYGDELPENLQVEIHAEYTLQP
jgi:hypothetical protein